MEFVKNLYRPFKQCDIGKILLRSLPYNGAEMYEIVDGKQRCNALWEFYTSQFPYKNTLFKDMNWKDRCHFEYYPLSVGEVPESTSNKEHLEIFLRVNTTGRVMSEEHLNKVRELYDKT